MARRQASTEPGYNIESKFIIADLAKQVECACAVGNSTDMPLLFSSCHFARFRIKGIRISEGLLY